MDNSDPDIITGYKQSDSSANDPDVITGYKSGGREAEIIPPPPPGAESIGTYQGSYGPLVGMPTGGNATEFVAPPAATEPTQQQLAQYPAVMNQTASVDPDVITGYKGTEGGAELGPQAGSTTQQPQTAGDQWLNQMGQNIQNVANKIPFYGEISKSVMDTIDNAKEIPADFKKDLKGSIIAGISNAVAGATKQVEDPLALATNLMRYSPTVMLSDLATGKKIGSEPSYNQMVGGKPVAQRISDITAPINKEVPGVASTTQMAGGFIPWLFGGELVGGAEKLGSEGLNAIGQLLTKNPQLAGIAQKMAVQNPNMLMKIGQFLARKGAGGAGWGALYGAGGRAATGQGGGPSASDIAGGAVGNVVLGSIMAPLGKKGGSPTETAPAKMNPMQLLAEQPKEDTATPPVELQGEVEKEAQAESPIAKPEEFTPTVMTPEVEDAYSDMPPAAAEFYQQHGFDPSLENESAKDEDIAKRHVERINVPVKRVKDVNPTSGGSDQPFDTSNTEIRGTKKGGKIYVTEPSKTDANGNVTHVHLHRIAGSAEQLADGIRAAKERTSLTSMLITNEPLTPDQHRVIENTLNDPEAPEHHKAAARMALRKDKQNIANIESANKALEGIENGTVDNFDIGQVAKKIGQITKKPSVLQTNPLQPLITMANAAGKTAKSLFVQAFGDKRWRNGVTNAANAYSTLDNIRKGAEATRPMEKGPDGKLQPRNPKEDLHVKLWGNINKEAIAKEGFDVSPESSTGRDLKRALKNHSPKEIMDDKGDFKNHSLEDRTTMAATKAYRMESKRALNGEIERVEDIRSDIEGHEDGIYSKVMDNTGEDLADIPESEIRKLKDKKGNPLLNPEEIDRAVGYHKLLAAVDDYLPWLEKYRNRQFGGNGLHEPDETGDLVNAITGAYANMHFKNVIHFLTLAGTHPLALGPEIMGLRNTGLAYALEHSDKDVSNMLDRYDAVTQDPREGLSGKQLAQQRGSIKAINTPRGPIKKVFSLSQYNNRKFFVGGMLKAGDEMAAQPGSRFKNGVEALKDFAKGKESTMTNEEKEQMMAGATEALYEGAGLGTHGLSQTYLQNNKTLKFLESWSGYHQTTLRLAAKMVRDLSSTDNKVAQKAAVALSAGIAARVLLGGRSALIPQGALRPMMAISPDATYVLARFADSFNVPAHLPLGFSFDMGHHLQFSPVGYQGNVLMNSWGSTIKAAVDAANAGSNVPPQERIRRFLGNLLTSQPFVSAPLGIGLDTYTGAYRAAANTLAGQKDVYAMEDYNPRPIGHGVMKTNFWTELKGYIAGQDTQISNYQFKKQLEAGYRRGSLQGAIQEGLGMGKPEVPASINTDYPTPDIEDAKSGGGKKQSTGIPGLPKLTNVFKIAK